jgi:hypothetical protein
MVELTFIGTMLVAGMVAIGWAARADQQAWRRRQALKQEWTARQRDIARR